MRKFSSKNYANTLYVIMMYLFFSVYILFLKKKIHCVLEFGKIYPKARKIYFKCCNYVNYIMKS